MKILIKSRKQIEALSKAPFSAKTMLISITDANDISVDGTKGYAVVEGTEAYEVEFTYDEGRISHLICSCFACRNRR